MLAASALDVALAPADSARAVAQVYSVSLLATLPLAAAAVAAVMLRYAAPGARALVWRAAVVALLALWFGRLLAPRWMTWAVPSELASPLVELGRAQLAAAGSLASAYLWGALAVYAAGVLAMLACVGRGWLLVRRWMRGARAPRDAGWTPLLAASVMELGVRRPVRLLVSPLVPVPMTCGVWRPVVLLPVAAEGWGAAHRRAALLHELAHVRAGDVAYALAARVACALYWFHPVVWGVARGLRAECERACDQRVLAAGVRRSTYAELLVLAADAAAGRRSAAPATGLALAGGAGLRARLADVLDVRRAAPAARARGAATAAAAVLTAAGLAATTELAPTRGVLERLMHDTRWESRAYAVVGLAQRPDSVDLARAAARHDPSPRVRAWAAYALAGGGRSAPPR